MAWYKTGGGGTDTSDATLNSGGQMLKDVTAYANDVKYTGTIESQAAATITPKVTSQTGVAAGKYTAGDITVGAIYEEVSSSATLDGYLADDNNRGKMYKFTGTTDTSYTNGSLYVCKEADVYNISCTLTNCTGDSSNPTTILENNTATLTFTANADYALPDTITVSGAEYTWTKSTGTLVLNKPTGAVSVTITAEVIIMDTWNKYEINYSYQKLYHWTDTYAVDYNIEPTGYFFAIPYDSKNIFPPTGPCPAASFGIEQAVQVSSGYSLYPTTRGITGTTISDLLHNYSEVNAYIPVYHIPEGESGEISTTRLTLGSIDTVLNESYSISTGSAGVYSTADNIFYLTEAYKEYSDSKTRGTYIEQVSVPAGTYPDNGTQDGYWYVKQV